METYLHSLPYTVERRFKRDQVHDILRELKPQLDTWGIVKISVKGVKPRLKDPDHSLDKFVTLRTKSVNATNPKSLLKSFELVTMVRNRYYLFKPFLTFQQGLQKVNGKLYFENERMKPENPTLMEQIQAVVCTQDP